MKKIVFIFIILLLNSCLALSQDSEQSESEAVQLSGYVLMDTVRSVPFAHVYIRGKPRGTICDFWGYFNFVVETGDTLVFSSVGYKKNYLVIPNEVPNYSLHTTQYLEKDTIMLPEATVFPWKTYALFKTLVLNIEIPEDDVDRARKNFAILKKQMQYGDYMVDASLNYKYYMQEKYDQLYYAGQTRPLSIFNIMAWNQFFKAIKNGDFKDKKEEETEDDYYKY